MGLTTLGIIHTAISLVAVFCGFYALFRDREISLKNRLGQTYVVTTLLTALTGFGIFQHGGFGPPHVLGVLTVLALAVGTVAGTTALFGRASRYVQAVSFTTTLLLFHMIPGFTESLTRLPPSAPLAASPEAPLLKGILAVLLVVFVVVLTLQLRWIRASSRR
jgi:uncharacterized membrane protein